MPRRSSTYEWRAMSEKPSKNNAHHGSRRRFLPGGGVFAGAASSTSMASTGARRLPGHRATATASTSSSKTWSPSESLSPSLSTTNASPLAVSATWRASWDATAARPSAARDPARTRAASFVATKPPWAKTRKTKLSASATGGATTPTRSSLSSNSRACSWNVVPSKRNQRAPDDVAATTTSRVDTSRLFVSSPRNGPRQPKRKSFATPSTAKVANARTAAPPPSVARDPRAPDDAPQHATSSARPAAAASAAVFFTSALRWGWKGQRCVVRADHVASTTAPTPRSESVAVSRSGGGAVSAPKPPRAEP
mmetsp:Transcript_11738/g.38454  ORF Transcript_11738/g.38454 Transcript_11738/m.38454 type:complete len:309 (+) Transcript_11738:125-1051(+)